MKFSIALTAALMTLWGSPCKAGLMFNITYAITDLSDVIPGQSVGLLVVDTDGDGFMGINDPDGTFGALGSYPLMPGEIVGDDLVLLSTTGKNIGGGSGFETNTILFDTDDAIWGGRLDANQDVSLIYFQNGTTNDGDPFGYYRDSSITDAALGGNVAYRIPGAGNDAVILTATSNSSFGGSVSPSSIARSTISGAVSVPEASQVLMSGFLACLLLNSATSRTRCRKAR